MIRYTTDGSNPKTNGGVYDGPFTVKKPVSVILAVANKDGIESAEQLRIDLSWKGTDAITIIPDKPAVWKRDVNIGTTKESYEMIALC